MESRITVGLACIGIAVAIGQWLIAPDAISYEIRFAIVVAAIVLAIIGLRLLALVLWQRLHGLTAKHSNRNRAIATTLIEKRDETAFDPSSVLVPGSSSCSCVIAAMAAMALQSHYHNMNLA